jgi:hypothetical protein
VEVTLAALLNRPLTIVAPGARTDDYGNPVPDWDNPIRIPALGYLEQTTAVEITLDRDTVISDWLLVVPVGTAINTLDQVDVDGITYEVVGAPWPADNPRLRVVDHIEARLRHVSG